MEEEEKRLCNVKKIKLIEYQMSNDQAMSNEDKGVYL